MAELIGVATVESNGLMDSSLVQTSIQSSSIVLNKIYEVRFNSKDDYGSIFISITHPYYSSLTFVFIPSKISQEPLVSSNILGTYRGTFILYKDSNSLYIKFKSYGADVLNIIPLSKRSIRFVDVTDTIDESTLTEI